MAFKSQEEIETLMKAAEVEMLVDELNALQWKGELAKLQRRLNKLKQA
jgi:ubiquinone biosynthesis protein UbiJ